MKRFVLLIVLVLLSGCDKISLFQSKDVSFLQSMQGRWNLNKDPINCYLVDQKLIAFDDNGGGTIFTPSGKFDEANKMLPVKVTIFSRYSEEDIWAKIAALACPMCDLAGMISTVYNLQKSDEEVLLLEGFKKGKENFLAAVIQLRSELKKPVEFNSVLYNNSSSDDSMRFALKNDSGEIIAQSSFIRKLNDEEIKFVPNIDGIVTERNKIIDKVIDSYTKSLESLIAIDKQQVEEQAKLANQAEDEFNKLVQIASQGDVLAQFNLATYYEDKDFVKSLMWFYVAANTDNNDTNLQGSISASIKKIESRATDQQISSAKGLATSCITNSLKGC